jgi:YHS domain-containing protein
MKRILIAVVMCCAISGVVAFATDKAPDKKTPVPATQPTTKPAVAINKFCAVDSDNPVDPSVPTVTYKGKVIGFCCEDCIPKFNKDPEFYMKTLK